MNGGGGNIRVSVAPAAAEAEPGIAIEIEDSGPGVPAELREQIFNPFVTSKKSGVGLGLSIVAKIVDDHHGSVQLTDRSEGGACFRIFLPSGESAGVAGEKHAKHPDC
jgi:two-component system nitrogen regulation sensor histidine kinase GlnL